MNLSQNKMPPSKRKFVELLSNRKLKLIVYDFLNYSIEGLCRSTINYINDRTGIITKDAFMSAAFKNKMWSGREGFINYDGIGLLRGLGDVLDVLEYDGGYPITKIDYEDHRSPKMLSLPYIDGDFLKNETGYKLHDYQEEGINKVIGLTYCDSGEGGILKLPTNAGKTIITMGISKVFDGIIKTLVLVPSANLAEQTYRDYQKSDMNTGLLSASIKGKKKRKDLIKNSDHIIMTNKLFLNLSELFQDEEWVLIYDEAHEFGDKTSVAIRSSLGHCQYRVGLTATMPGEKGDKYKDTLIRHHFGDNLVELDQKELIDRGISSKLHIDLITIKTDADVLSHTDSGWDWQREQQFYSNNYQMFLGMLEVLKSESDGNSLILCHPDLGGAIGEELEIDLVQDDVPVDVRQGWYDTFKTRDDYSLLATFGCASTGLSINNIQTLFLLEIGQDRTRIMQSIGRGLRLDGVTNEIRVVDISSDTKYAAKHRKKRLSIYKSENFYYEDYRTIDMRGN